MFFPDRSSLDVPTRSPSSEVRVLLQEFSTVRVCNQSLAIRVLNQGSFDPVVFPLNRPFPGSSVLPSPCPFNQSDSVRSFLTRAMFLRRCSVINLYQSTRSLVPPPPG